MDAAYRNTVVNYRLTNEVYPQLMVRCALRHTCRHLYVYFKHLMINTAYKCVFL